MWLHSIFDRNKKTAPLLLFDEVFMQRLERFSFRTAPTLRGAMAGERPSRKLRAALDFSDHRPYAPGDDWRFIDWKAYSRHEELFVKLGESPQSVNIHILLDCSSSMVWSPARSVSEIENNLQDPQSNKWDRARRLAGALGYLGLAGGERLEFTPFAHTLDYGFGPIQGKRQIIPLLQFITGIPPSLYQAEKEGGGLVHSLTSYAGSHPQGGLLILISDLLNTATPFSSEEPSLEAELPYSPDEEEQAEGIEEWEDLAEALRYFPPPRWQVLVLHLLTEPEINPTLEGDFDLQDLETGQSLPFHLDEATLAQYRLRVRRWCADVQSACARRGATYARVLAEWPFEKAVIPYLRQRGVIQ